MLVNKVDVPPMLTSGNGWPGNRKEIYCHGHVDHAPGIPGMKLQPTASSVANARGLWLINRDDPEKKNRYKKIISTPPKMNPYSSIMIAKMKSE